jgi:hypothetical protein
VEAIHASLLEQYVNSGFSGLMSEQVLKMPHIHTVQCNSIKIGRDGPSVSSLIYLSMIKISFISSLVILLSLNAWSQEAKVFELEQVEIIPNDQILIFSNFSKRSTKKDVPARVFNKIGIVSEFVNQQSNDIQLEGIELFFKYDWEEDSSGFYVRPVVIKEEKSLPGSPLLDFHEMYLVTKKLKDRLYIDLSSKNIEMAPGERLYLGIRFLENVNPDVQDIFSITLVNEKNSGTSYVLTCNTCEPEEMVSTVKNPLAMKYSVVYKLKN